MQYICGMREFVWKYRIPVGVAIIGFFNILGGNVVSSLFESVWPNGAKWIVDNRVAYAIMWMLVVCVSFLLKLNHDKKTKIRGLEGYDPDFLFFDAMILIENNKKWKGLTEVQIQKVIFNLAYRRKLTIWGQPAMDIKAGPPTDTLVEIPHYFFYDVVGGRHSDGGYYLQRYSDSPDPNENIPYKCVFNAKLNHDQIKEIFLRSRDKTLLNTISGV
jgi:hypothetical protein